MSVITVRLTQADGTTFEGIGYGAAAEEAMVGALGEPSEVAHCQRALRDMLRVAGGHVELRHQQGDRGVADPLTLCLPAGSSYQPEQPLVWVVATRVATVEPVWIPEEFAADSVQQLHRGAGAPRGHVESKGGMKPSPFEAPMVTTITNGLGANTSFAQALVHGLLELLQRDGNALFYRALDRGNAIDIDESALHDASLAALLTQYRNVGVEIMAKVAATDFGMLNVVVVGAEAPPEAEFPIRLTACGQAVHPDRERALRNALLEFAASRCRKMFRHGSLARLAGLVPYDFLARAVGNIDLAAEEPRALQAMVEWLGASEVVILEWLVPVLAVSHSINLRPLPSVAPGLADNPHERLALVAGRLADAGLDVLVVDFSPPDEEIVALKAVVPGLEMETMRYHRIGERGQRRLLDRGSERVGGHWRLAARYAPGCPDGCSRGAARWAGLARRGGHRPSVHAAQLQLQLMEQPGLRSPRLALSSSQAQKVSPAQQPLPSLDLER